MLFLLLPACTNYSSLDVLSSPSNVISLGKLSSIDEDAVRRVRGYPLQGNQIMVEVFLDRPKVDSWLDANRFFLIDLESKEVVPLQISIDDPNCLDPKIWHTEFNDSGVLTWVRCEGEKAIQNSYKIYVIENESEFEQLEHLPISFDSRYVTASNSFDKFMILDRSVSLETRDALYMVMRLVELNFDFDRSIQLFPEGFRAKYASWSSDDQQIAFMGNMERPRQGDSFDLGPWDLYKVDSQLIEYERLVETIWFTNTPHWSKDGKLIFFSGLHQNVTGDWMYEVESSNVYLLNNQDESDVDLTLLHDESQFFDVSYDAEGLTIFLWNNSINKLLQESG